MYDRWETINFFLKYNKKKVIYSNELKINESDFIPINHTNFMANTHEDIWNYLAFLRILKFLNLGNIKFIKKNLVIQIMNFFLSLETNFFF